MSAYYVANDKVDLKCYPNYSFEIGDVNGDGKMEFISLDRSGNLLRVLNLDGEPLFERTLCNDGNWGTPLVCVADIDGDGCGEVIVPSGGGVIAFDDKGRKVRERVFEGCQKDDYGVGVPLLGAARVVSPGKPAVIAVAAGGSVYALDSDFNTVWKTDQFRRDFGHEIHIADIDGDGLDEIAFCTVDRINGTFNASNPGELVVLDHDGGVLLREPVGRYYDDSHFDDIAMADFLGNGTAQILLEKGMLLDLRGNILWDISDQMDHGQWITHTPDTDGKGELVFISEVWGTNMKSMLFSGQGQKIKDINGFPWPKFAEPNTFALPTRCHAVRWDARSEPEFFLAQQAYVKYDVHTHLCKQTRGFRLAGLFMDLRGDLIGEMPFEDTQIEGYFYNGEVHSRVADVDGDGRQEIVFPKQDGRVMIIKKRV